MQCCGTILRPLEQVFGAPSGTVSIWRQFRVGTLAAKWMEMTWIYYWVVSVFWDLLALLAMFWNNKNTQYLIARFRQKGPLAARLKGAARFTYPLSQEDKSDQMPQCLIMYCAGVVINGILPWAWGCNTIGFLYISNSGSANAQPPGCFCPWTFSLNIGLDMFPLDSFMLCLHSLPGYSTGEFQALQLIVLAAFDALDYPLAPCMLEI